MVPKLLYTACPGEVIDIDALDLDDADWPLPEPCIACGKPASPFVATESGPVCFACADGPGTPPGARAAWRDAVLARTHHRLVAARVARELAPVLVPALACRG
jgi:hypothetical protein